MTVSLSVADESEIVDMFSAGISMRKIAEHFQVTHNRISKILGDKGYTSEYRKLLPEKEVIGYYFSDPNITQARVADKYGVSAGTIGRIFKKNGIQIKRAHRNMVDLDTDLIVEKYKKKMPTDEIAQFLDISKSTVNKQLRDAGVEIRDASEAQQKYTLNESFFDKINTEDRAYWLGFMFAAGYVKSNLRDFGITLSVADKDHVQKFINAIEYTDKVRIYQPLSSGFIEANGYARCVPANRRVCSDLIAHGCVPRKTHTTEAPIGVPTNLTRHFIRGVVDGDGGIYIYEKHISVEVVGDRGLLEWIKEVSPVSLSELQAHKSIWRIRTRKDTALSFCKWIYEDSTVFLDRKYKRYLNALERLDNDK